ncbi:GspH/FimT family pseudopilin [Ramlibacter sp. USB13]|uniref:Type II secretion system protein H n=1 Tax=Ramlibacter cellulosilyticus TaxID=2764187 RepID=A0A923MUR4_9BURK|nr:GspH/FimT family pseudopilin [Ramlibacter cellulosilyticus]MBC5785009.1 GspH/FimT family pseudopilin [Ramlibacter cellulosilyticus]
MHGARAFTLLELLVTLCVASVLLSVAVPSLARLHASAQLSTIARGFLESLRLARSEAVKRGGRVVMCKSANGTTCADTGGWDQGWIIFQDNNANGAHEANETLIQQTQALDRDVVLTGNAPVARSFTFVGQAASRTGTGAMQAGTLTVCRRFAEEGGGRQIVVSSGGRADIRRLKVLSCG